MESVLAHIGAAFAALNLHFSRLRFRYIVLGALTASFVFICILPPVGFPEGHTISIEKTSSVGAIAEQLQNEGLINSAILFKVIVRVVGYEHSIQAGEYYFENAIGSVEVATRLANGDSRLPSVRITFPEGTTSREMAQVLAERIPNFSASDFVAFAASQEGYLFPDTYDFPLTTTPKDAFERLINTFVERVQPLQPDIEASGQTLEEIITMASLIETEANTEAGRHVVAGILWRRIEIGMALQVDAVFGYIKGTDTYHPSGADLEIDSPYNTYMNRGLPPGPITNPGLDAIRAALRPTQTDYLYYLTGTDGTMRYARTFEEHKRNKELYLK